MWRHFAAGSWGGRFIRYGAVGIVGIGVNFAVLRLLWPWLGSRPSVAAALATEAAILSNYFLNARFTFRQPPGWKSWLRFNLAMAGGGLLQTGIFTLLVHWGWYYLVANLVAIPFATAVGFVVSNLWVFRRRPLAAAEPEAGGEPGYWGRGR